MKKVSEKEFDEIVTQNGVSIHKRGKYPYTAIWKKGRKIVAKQKPYVMHINSTDADVSFFIKRTKYKVRSGELNKTVWAISQEKAIKKAIKRHSRKSGRRLGHYISVVENGKDELSDASFFLTDTILDMLDFKVVKE